MEQVPKNDAAWLLSIRRTNRFMKAFLGVIFSEAAGRAINVLMLRRGVAFGSLARR
jgi:hypothetical protein